MSHLFFVSAQAESTGAKDIRDLSQHFIDPDNYSPWIFVPEDNIQSLSLVENPGLATIRHAEKGKDIKGILKDPTQDR